MTGLRKIENEACCVCGRDAATCLQPERGLCGVVRIAPARWICVDCSRAANAEWVTAAIKAVR